MSGMIFISPSVKWCAKTVMFHAIIDRIRPEAEEVMGVEEASSFFSAVDSELNFLDLCELSPHRFMQVVKIIQKACEQCMNDPILSKWYDGAFVQRCTELLSLIESDARYRPML